MSDFRSCAELVGPATVTDDDTLAVTGQPIRLFGIDAPESKQTPQVVDEVIAAEWWPGTESNHRHADSVRVYFPITR